MSDDYEDELNDTGLDTEEVSDDEINGETSAKSCVSEEERLQMAMKQIAHLESELTDFKQSSYELEEELEKELNDLVRQNEDLEDKVKTKQKELELWKEKYLKLEEEFNNLNNKNEEKFKNYKKELQSVRSKLVNIEILNDNIEQNERILSINLNDLESKYNDSLEKIALVESEMNYKDELLLKERLNHQNTKNQLLELQAQLDKSSQQNQVSSDTIARTELRTGLAKSNSMKQLHNMIEQTKFMENRVETIRNTIRPSKMRKVSGKTIIAQPTDSDTSYVEGSSEYDISNVSSLANSSFGNTTYFSTLSKSTTNDSLNHSKAKNRRRKLNLQKPPIQPLKLKEFSNHWADSPVTTIKMVAPSASTSLGSSSKSGTKGSIKRSGSHHSHYLGELEPIQGSPSGKTKTVIVGKTLDPRATAKKSSEVKKLFNSPKGKPRRKGGLLPSLRKFNIN